MGNIIVNLIDEQKIPMEEVVSSLLIQKSGTKWAEKTNKWAVEYVKTLTNVYGDVWHKGLLSEEFLSDILLPKHGHSDKEKDDEVFFPLDTSVEDAISYLEKNNSEHSKECMALVYYLKEEIKQKGFTSPIILAVINGTLKHVDGLHRIIALALLLREGYVYKPIPVFLCDSTK